MGTPRELSAHALQVAREQLARLQEDELEAYLRGSDDYERLCAELLRCSLDQFDDEAGAIVVELARVQRQLCRAFDTLIDRAAADMRVLRKNQRIATAYRAGLVGPPGRARAG
jgi:hypothetical protein